MTWLMVKQQNGALANPDGTIRSLNPSVAPPWEYGGDYAPYHWETRPADSSPGGYEVCAVNGTTVCYNPTGVQPVVFGFQPIVPHSDGFSAISEEPIRP